MIPFNSGKIICIMKCYVRAKNISIATKYEMFKMVVNIDVYTIEEQD